MDLNCNEANHDSSLLTVCIGALAFENYTQELKVPPGTVSEVIGDIPESLHHEIIVIHDEKIIPPEQWATHDCTGVQSPLYIEVVPRNRKILRVGALLGVAIASFGFGGTLAASFGFQSAFAASAFGAGLNVIGSVLVNAIFPPETPGSPSFRGRDRDPQRFGIQGISNQFPGRRDIVLMVMGTHRVVPPHAVKPYSYVVSSEQQGYRALFDFGHGPITFDTDSFKFGDQPVSSFDNATIVTYDGTEGVTNDALTRFGEIHNQTGVGRQLTTESSWSTFDYPAGTKRVIFSIGFNGLLSLSKSGDKRSRSVSFEAGVVGGAMNTFTATGSTDSGYFFEVRVPIPDLVNAGQVRIRRVTAESTSVRVRDDALLSAVDYVSDGPAVVAKGRAMAFVQVIAAENLNNTVQTFNAVVTRRVPRWSGTAWTDPGTAWASNPAWQLADLLRGPGLSDPVPSAQIDTDSITAFAQHCDDRAYLFNGVFSDSQGVWDRLGQVASAGRGSPNFIDGSRFGVVIDRKKTVPVDLITPKDSLSFSGEKSFTRVPHAFRATYNDALNEYMASEIIVYRDGFNAGNSIDIRYVNATLFGATSAGEVHKLLRYLMAVALLRPEVFRVTQDIKQLRLQRGDYVDLQFDAPLIGLGSGRMTKRDTSGGKWRQFSLDERIDLEGGDSYTARFQNLDGTAIVVPIEENTEINVPAQTISGSATGMFSN